jgi:hypothetical protein
VITIPEVIRQTLHPAAAGFNTSSAAAFDLDVAGGERMASTLAEFLAQYTAAEEAYPATAFLPLTCPCGSDHFRLARAGSSTQRTCSRCGAVRTIARFGDSAGWEEAVQYGEGEESFYCTGCGADKASVCLGFAGYPEAPGVDAVKWFYVGVRCCVCGRDECFNDGKVGRGPMAEAVFREVAGEAPREGGTT